MRTEKGLSAWMCSTVSPTSRTLVRMSAAPSGTASHGSESTSGVERRLLAWRRRLERRRTVRDVALEVPGARRPLQFALPADPDAVLDELASPEPHMPYWATLWPSGLALAEVALARRAQLAGRRVLELGCGLGTSATALAAAGALPTGVDCFGEALAYARYNVLRNTGRQLSTRRLDWRTAEGVERLGQLETELVVAADVLYERDDVAPLLALGERALNRGVPFWLAEPGRATSARFVEQARARGWRGEMEVIERDWPALVGVASVRVHLFEPS